MLHGAMAQVYVQCLRHVAHPLRLGRVLHYSDVLLSWVEDFYPVGENLPVT